MTHYMTTEPSFLWMRSHSLRLLFMACWLGPLLGCHETTGLPTSQPAEASTCVESQTPGTPARAREAYAEEWMDLLRSKDIKALSAASRYPLQLRDTRSESDCVNGTAETAEQMPALVQCLVSDELLQEDVKANPEPLAETVAAKDLQAWAAQWIGELQPGVSLVHVSIPGNGAAFHLILLTTERGVQGIWKDVTFEAN
jgi:hypothetical protein